MAGETMRFRNPAGHAGLLHNLVSLLNSLAGFLESRLALVAAESKTALVHVLVLVACLAAAAHSRDRLGRDLSGLRYELDFPLKFRKSFQRQTVLWIGAAIVVGVVFAIMPARTRKDRGKAKTKDKGEQ